MSGFSRMHGDSRPGVGLAISPDSIFRNGAERAAYQSIVDGTAARRDFKVKRVKVEIFDLSDSKQVRKYEKLWKSLLERSANAEVIVESHKDLVHRPDGTSYWMKYVEYVELGPIFESNRQ